MAHKFLRDDGWFQQVVPGDVGASTTSTGFLGFLTNSLSTDVSLNNTANYFDGPVVTQGTSGVWLAMGEVTVSDASAAGTWNAKLWDGTTVMASGSVNAALGQNRSISLAGVLTNPAGNIKISVRDILATTGLIKASFTGEGKDSNITVVRIG